MLYYTGIRKHISKNKFKDMKALLFPLIVLYPWLGYALLKGREDKIRSDALIILPKKKDQCISFFKSLKVRGAKVSSLILVMLGQVKHLRLLGSRN